MEEGNIDFPCMVKVDQSSAGRGNSLVHNSQERKEIVVEISDKCFWTGKYILQEYIPESGDVHWLGNLTGTISKDLKWVAGMDDWNKQEVLKKAVNEEFILPVKTFLYTTGYFGIVNIEILEKEGGRYLVDLNSRIPSVLPQLFIAPYMAALGLPKSLTSKSKILRCKRKDLSAMAEEINEKGPGKVIVLAAADVDRVFEADLGFFAETMSGIDGLIDILEQDNKNNTS